MKQILFSAIISAFLISPVAAQKSTTADSKALLAKQAIISKVENVDNFNLPSEEFSFLIEDFKMNHQSELNNLNIRIRYCYQKRITESQYPDFRVLLKDIEDFLTNYPNKVDYWEILNKKLTTTVLRKYPALESITSKIQISPSPKVAYLRSSIVTRDRSNKKRR